MMATPAGFTNSTAATEPRPLNQRSCRKCNQRKTRCSKSWPCDNCVKLDVECVFPPPGRAPRRKKRPLKAELVSQVKDLEQKLQHLGEERPAGIPPRGDTDGNDFGKGSSISQIPVDDGHGAAVLDIPNPTPDIKANRESQLGQLLVENGNCRYVSHQALVSIENGEKTCPDESQGLMDYDSSTDEETSSSGIESGSFDNTSAFLFGYHSVAHSLLNFHPSRGISQILWGAYERNVAPVIKVLYKPVVEDLISRASVDAESLGKGSEALVFAVYFAAVTSMKPHQIQAEFGDDYHEVILRYRFAIEQALTRADFIHTHSLTVMQAAVLYLIAVWSSRDVQFVWTMTATIYRVAQGLGLHRDGTKLGVISPFETEIRRRIWWHIYLLDSLSSEHLASPTLIREGTYDTKFPLNINDDDISPDSTDPVKEHEGFTETTFFLIRCEMTASCRQSIHGLKSKPNGCCESVEKYSQVLSDLNSLIETRYLQFYDIQIPVQWAAATMARIALARSFLVNHLCLLKSGSIGTEIWHQKREVLFLTAIEVVEFAHMLETNERTAHWSWMFEICQQWHAFAFILSELCVRSASPVSDRAWAAVNVVYRQWKQRRSNRKWVLWRPLSRLMKRVTAIRAGPRTAGMDVPPVRQSPAVQNESLVDSQYLASMWASQDEPQPYFPVTAMDLDAAKESMDIYKWVMEDFGNDIDMD